MPNERADHLLEVNNLTIEFGSQRSANGPSKPVVAVDQVSFKISKGETLGVVGESGSGKSITALSLLGLVPAPGRVASGEILYNSPMLGEVDLLQLTENELRVLRGGEIAIIFQDPMTSLNPVFTCGEQLVEALQLHNPRMTSGDAKKRALELLSKVKLPRPEQILNTYPHALSGGQKQRVMIAMALSCNPSLLIADEPTTALDVTVQHCIIQLLQELREEIDTAILFISHDLGIIAEVADRVLVMYNGKIVEQGPVWDLFANPQHPYTKGLLACRPRLDVKLKVLPTVSDFMDADAGGEVIEIVGNKFRSVGEAITKNYQTSAEVKARYEKLIAQTPIVTVRDLHVHFPLGHNFFGRPKGIVKAVDGVTFDIYPGETLGLVGESGCGKSTLGRALLQLAHPTAGSIIFHDYDLCKVSTQQMRRFRRDIQIIFQDPYSSLNPRMTIGEAIVEPMRFHQIGHNERERRDMAMQLLETVNLSQVHFSRYPHEFSGGQRQRICIARTLALQPKFIVCDESVSALDVSVQAQVLNLLNRLKEKYQLTYVFISHDLSVVKFLADRILVMQNGQIIESGAAEDIYENPVHEYTRTLIRSIPKGSMEDIRRAMLRRKKLQPPRRKALVGG
ncbi:MAG: ABC transporter ATP-binding protein [Bernardetiaceae bacterium]|jgi:peptide/nickel transport system ATP-binding protein|nr:ABC transporter ATP-binding protein [Bernardetiaceae bacterium]